MEANDDKVLKPVMKHLSKQDDAMIFKFEDMMSELLYNLDTKNFIEQCRKQTQLPAMIPFSTQDVSL